MPICRRLTTFLLLLLVACAPALALDSLDAIKARGTLRAGVRYDAPPFSFLARDSKFVTGYDVDYLEAIGKRLGVKVEYHPARLAELTSGDLDILAANLTRSAALEAAIDFSSPFLATGQGFLARKGIIRNMTSLFGKKIGTVMGSPSETCARNVCAGGTIVPFPDYDQALVALRKGEIDAFTTDESILTDLSVALPRDEFEIPGLLISRQDYVFGFQKGNKTLADAVNAIIAEMEADGSGAKLKARWFSPSEERPPAAYAAILRKAATPPRFLAVVLDGIFFNGAEVALFTANGDALGRAVVAGVSGDELYIDADEAAYPLVRPGFLVTLNVSPEMARQIADHQRKLLDSVGKAAEADADKIRLEADKEAIERNKREQELQLIRDQNSLLLERERQYFRYLNQQQRNFPRR